MLVDDILEAIEAAKEKVMADEIRERTKAGMPRKMAEQEVAARFHVKVEDEEGGSGTPEFDAGWHDIN